MTHTLSFIDYDGQLLEMTRRTENGCNILARHLGLKYYTITRDVTLVTRVYTGQIATNEQATLDWRTKL